MKRTDVKKYICDYCNMVREKREEKGLTREALSEKLSNDDCDVSVTDIVRFENAKHLDEFAKKMYLFILLFEEFNISVDEVFKDVYDSNAEKIRRIREIIDE